MSPMKPFTYAPKNINFAMVHVTLKAPPEDWKHTWVYMSNCAAADIYCCLDNSVLRNVRIYFWHAAICKGNIKSPSCASSSSSHSTYSVKQQHISRLILAKKAQCEREAPRLNVKGLRRRIFFKKSSFFLIVNKQSLKQPRMQ